MNKRSLRYGSAIALLALAALAVLVRYASLASEKGGEGIASELLAQRGPILDREGRLLALDSPLYNIAVWRPETDREAFPAEASRLAGILDIESEALLERWEKGTSDFFYLKKRAAPQLARAVQEAKAAGSFPGVVVERVAGRLYPEKRLGSHLLGFVGDGNRGLSGVENKYESELLPTNVSGAPGLAPRGRQIVLSIDADLQFALEEIGRKAMAETGAESLILLAGDALTGEILSYVAMPDFDPNEYLASPESSWKDLPSNYAFEPGSVFKVFSMAAALDLGGIGEGTTFHCDGAYRRTAPSGEKIVIKCLGVHGDVTIKDILELSCNAGAAYAADSIQSLDFYERLKSFGFGSRTGITLPGESPGALRSPESWSLRSKPTIAMGQEVLVTAVQMLAAAGAVANGGLLLKPITVRKVLGPEGELIYENAPQVVRRVMSEATAASILSSMEAGAGESGTGRRAKVADIRMAVKTGTAQMIDPQTKRYSDTDFIASTLAIFPLEEPRLVLYLAIVKPTGESYGGRIAAPLVREAAEAILGLSELPRGASPSLLHSGAISLPRLAAPSLGDFMPDLTGQPKRLLLPLLGRDDIKVRIEGEGYVVRQRPAPGERIQSGAEIVLELE